MKVFKIAIIGLFCLWFSCDSASPEKPIINLDGHWHLTSTRERESLSIMEIKDSHVVFNQAAYYGPPWGCKLDRLTGDILSSASGTSDAEWKRHFKCTLTGDTLIMNNLEQGSILKGIRVKQDFCSFEQDYYRSEKIKLDLPLKDSQDKLIRNHDMEFLFGYPKKEFQNEFSDSLRIGLVKGITPPYNKSEGRMIKLEQWPKANQVHHLLKHTKPGDATISILIHADKNIPIHQLAELVNSQRQIEETEFYLAAKMKEPLSEYEKFTSFKIDEIELDDANETIESWLLRQETVQ